MDAYLTRYETSAEGTQGIFCIPSIGFSSVTMELPWRDNEPNISCIPVGDYICEAVSSPKYGPVYEVKDVDGRTHILHHRGNWGGDKELGYKSDIKGCILHGRRSGVLEGQNAVLSSSDTIKQLMCVTGGKTLALKIREI